MPPGYPCTVESSAQPAPLPAFLPHRRPPLPDETDMTRTKRPKRAPAKPAAKGKAAARRAPKAPSASAPAPAPAPALRVANSELRRTDRTQLFVAATLYTELNPDVAHQVWVTNVSLGGVGFRTRRAFAPGSVFHARLDAGPIQLDTGVRVVWTRPTPDNTGTFDVGCVFLPD